MQSSSELLLQHALDREKQLEACPCNRAQVRETRCRRVLPRNAKTFRLWWRIHARCVCSTRCSRLGDTVCDITTMLEVFWAVQAHQQHALKPFTELTVAQASADPRLSLELTKLFVLI